MAKGFQHKYLKTDSLYTQPDLNIDLENGIVRNVSICTVGEAKGHDVFLEDEFITDVVRLANSFPMGLKCRFGHPTMSGEALGTYLGRFKSFRVVGNKAVADLYLDKVSQTSPNGDLYSYVLQMAQSNPDMFGASVCFEPEYYYYYDSMNNRVIGTDSDKVFVKIKALAAADIVDDPAANENGLFSSSVLHSDKFAVIVTKFLDANPSIWALLDKNPHKFQPFLKRYAAYRSKIDRLKPKRKPKGLFGRLAAALVAAEQYATIDTAISTGEDVRIVMVGDEPAVGDEVYVVQEDGTEIPAPDGDHTISSGDYEGHIISVVDGKITSIVVPDDIPGTEGVENLPVSDATEDFSTLRKQLQDQQKEISNLRTQLATIRNNPIDEHTKVGAEDDPIGAAAGVNVDEKFWQQPWNKNKRKPI